MPRRKKPRLPDNVEDVFEEGPHPVQDAYRVETVVQDEDTELDQVFSDFPQNEACIEIFRVNAHGGRPLFLERIMPAAFDFSYVAEKFGGGRYVAKGKYRDGTRKKMSFEIEGEPFPYKRKVLSNDPMMPVGPVPPPVTERIVEQIGPDPQAAMMSLMKTMIQEIKSNETALLEKMRLYKELFAPGERREAPLDTAINMLTRGIELGQSGGEGGGIPWLAVIREVKDPLMKLADSIHAAVTKRVPVSGQDGVPLAGPAASAPESKPEESPMLGVLKYALPDLLLSASRGEDVDGVADRLLDQIPQSQYPTLLAWLNDPGCLDQLVRIEPGINYQRHWWTALRASLLDLLIEDTSDGDSGLQSQPDSIASAVNSSARGSIST